MDRYEVAIEAWFENLKMECLNKYRLGRKEHGGEPVDVQCWKEIGQEVMDIINYFVIHKVNNEDL